MKNNLKLIALVVIVLGITMISACRSQQGCPNNFSIELTK